VAPSRIAREPLGYEPSVLLLDYGASLYAVLPGNSVLMKDRRFLAQSTGVFLNGVTEETCTPNDQGHDLALY
jgi:hypothetical protein